MKAQVVPKSVEASQPQAQPAGLSHPDPIVRRLHACALARVPAVLWGEPGTGKTARIRAYAISRALLCERFILSRCEPIDLKPRMYQDGCVIVAQAPEYARLEQAGGGILFYDELNRASREVEGAALDTIDSPPPGVIVFAACNPPSRGQAARALESAASNRFCHLDVQVDPKAWASAVVGGWDDAGTRLGDVPAPILQAATARANALVSAFIRRRPELLDKPPADPVSAGKAWPSSRTWTYALRLYAVATALSLDTDDTNALVSGVIGQGAAVEFLTFALEADLPDPETLLKEPKKYSPPKGRVDKTIAALTAVSQAIESQFTDSRWKAGWALLQVCCDADQADAAMAGGDLLQDVYYRLTRKDAPAAKALTPAHHLIPDRMALLINGSRG